LPPAYASQIAAAMARKAAIHFGGELGNPAGIRA
jgi:hypothetical protein